MKFIESCPEELKARRFPISAAPTPSPNRSEHSAGLLSRELRDASSRGWLLFRIDATSKYASEAVVKANIGKATNQIDELEMELGQNSECTVGLLTGRARGVFVVEVVGATGFTARIGMAVLCLESDGDDWRTLTSRGGGSKFAFFRYPKGWTSKARKQLESGIIIHGEDGYVPIVPSASHAYRDPPDMPVRVAPRWLIELAFERSSGDSTPSTPRISLQPANAGCCPAPARYGAAVRRSNIARKGNPACGVGALRGKFHSSRRN